MSKLLSLSFLALSFVTVNSAFAEDACKAKGYYELSQTEMLPMLDSITRSACDVWLLRDDLNSWNVDSSRVQFLASKGFIPNIIDVSEISQNVKLNDLVIHFEKKSASFSCAQNGEINPNAHQSYSEFFALQELIAYGQFKDLAFAGMSGESYLIGADETAKEMQAYVYDFVPNCVKSR